MIKRFDYNEIGRRMVMSNCSLNGGFVARMLDPNWKEHDLYMFMLRNGIVDEDGFAIGDFESVIEICGKLKRRDKTSKEVVLDSTYLIRPKGLQILLDHLENEYLNDAP